MDDNLFYGAANYILGIIDVSSRLLLKLFNFIFLCVKAELVTMILRWLPEDITVHNEDLEGISPLLYTISVACHLAWICNFIALHCYLCYKLVRYWSFV